MSLVAISRRAAQWRRRPSGVSDKTGRMEEIRPNYLRFRSSSMRRASFRPAPDITAAVAIGDPRAIVELRCSVPRSRQRSRAAKIKADVPPRRQERVYRRHPSTRHQRPTHNHLSSSHAVPRRTSYRDRQCRKPTPDERIPGLGRPACQALVSPRLFHPQRGQRSCQSCGAYRTDLGGPDPMAAGTYHK